MNNIDSTQSNSLYKPETHKKNLDVIDITNSESDIMSLLSNSHYNDYDARFHKPQNHLMNDIDDNNYEIFNSNGGGCNDLNNYEIILLLACKYDYTIIVDFILSNDIVKRFDISLNDSHTPLHFIIENWKDDMAHKKILNLLLNKKNIKTFVNSIGINGDTPIVLAAKKGFTYICELLDKCGADKSIENRDGLCVITDESEQSNLSGKITTIPVGNVTRINIAKSSNIIDDNDKTFLKKNAGIFLSGLIQNRMREQNNLSDTSIYSLLSSNVSAKKNNQTFINNLDKFVENIYKSPANIQKGGKINNNSTIYGTRQMFCFNTNRNSNPSINKKKETLYVSELDKLINEQVSMINTRANNNVQSLLNTDKKNAQDIINKIYTNIDQQNPSLKHLDKAMAMEKYINLDDLNILTNNQQNPTTRTSHSDKPSYKKSSIQKSSKKKSSKKKLSKKNN